MDKRALLKENAVFRGAGLRQLTNYTPLHNRVRDQLEIRFGQDLKPGERINEAEIAADLGVSRTPIRTVLRQMQSEGIVEYEQHRGFRLVKSTERVAKSDTESSALLDERVMRDMALGKLGSPISERALMQRYSVAHGILMSTLRSLMRDQLVEPTASRGWIFADVGANALANGYRFRQIVEPASMLADIYEVDIPAIEALDAEHQNAISNIEAMDRRRLFDLDAKFHRQVALGAKSTHLVDAIERQNNIRRVNEYIGFTRLDRIRDSMMEHRKIMAALLIGERQLAAALMRVHLQISRAETFEHIDEDLELVRTGRVKLGMDDA
jgi:DNA-binding GntR family transcriptional regulator